MANKIAKQICACCGKEARITTMFLYSYTNKENKLITLWFHSKVCAMDWIKSQLFTFKEWNMNFYPNGDFKILKNIPESEKLCLQIDLDSKIGNSDYWIKKINEGNCILRPHKLWTQGQHFYIVEEIKKRINNECIT